jgi:hypothetical protein
MQRQTPYQVNILTVISTGGMLIMKSMGELVKNEPACAPERAVDKITVCCIDLHTASFTRVQTVLLKPLPPSHWVIAHPAAFYSPQGGSVSERHIDVYGCVGL